MGKYATYAMRGSNTIGPALPEPPAPVLTLPANHVVQTSSGVADPGGTIEIWQSAFTAGIYTRRSGQGWASPTDWGDATAWGVLFIKAIEIGNGKVYRGTSPWSNVLSINQ